MTRLKRFTPHLYRVQLPRAVAAGVSLLLKTGLYGQTSEEAIVRMLERALENRCREDGEFADKLRLELLR